MMLSVVGETFWFPATMVGYDATGSIGASTEGDLALGGCFTFPFQVRESNGLRFPFSVFKCKNCEYNGS